LTLVEEALFSPIRFLPMFEVAQARPMPLLLLNTTLPTRMPLIQQDVAD
jgi:hypothetical protein